MKKTILSISAVVLCVITMAAFTTEPKRIADELEIGAKAPLTNVSMQDISGASYSLDDLKGDKGLLVVFSMNVCPWVHAWEDRYLTIADQARELGIGMAVLNSNEKTRDAEDSPEEMKKRAADLGYNFPYLIDKDHKLADAFGASKTPHIYLFDNSGTLVYRGAIDDNRNASEVENTYLADALSALAAGSEIPVSTSKALGCTIKRVE